MGASWKNLAERPEWKLDELGIELSQRDRHLLGDLEMLDARCQDLPRWVEGLAATPSNPEEWEVLSSHVGRLLAEVKLLKWEATRIHPPLERLLSSICSVRNPRKHMEKLSRARRRQS